MLRIRLDSLLSKRCCQYDKKYSQISGFQLTVEEKHLCLNGQNILFLPLPLLRLFVVREKAVLGKKRAHGECIIPGDFKSFARGECDFAKACFEKGWWFCAIFSFHLPPFPSTSSPLLSCPPLPLLFTSVHPFIILRRALLTVETPLCTQVLLRPHSSPQQPRVDVCLCVCVCQSLSEREQERWSDLAWQTGFVIQYFKLYTNLPEPLIHCCSGSNGGYSLGSWVHSLKWLSRIYH